jgi:ferredoxin
VAHVRNVIGSRQEFQVMPHIICEPCVGTKDTACVAVCPVDCIHPRKDEVEFEKATMLYIDPDTCIDCGLCVDECPVKAIFTEDDTPTEWKNFVQINADYYKKK